VELDPRIEEELRSRVVEGGEPDLRIESLRARPEDPVSGETIWIDAAVVNEGTGESDSVDLIAFQGTAPGAERISAWKPRQQDRWALEPLYPGESRTVELRWDPVKNAGRQVIRVEIDPQNRLKESDEENNSATVEVSVRKKADILVIEQLVARKVFDGTSAIRFQIMNFGETPAMQEFRVELRFYKDPEEEPIKLIPYYFTEKEPDRFPMKPRPFYFRSDWVTIPEGTKWVEVLADPDEIVDEETHANNRVFLPIGEVKDVTKTGS
jgi:hypothetical protein